MKTVLHHFVAELGSLASIIAAGCLAYAGRWEFWAFVGLSLIFSTNYKTFSISERSAAEPVAKRYDILDSNGASMGLSAKTREELPALGAKDTAIEWTARKIS